MASRRRACVQIVNGEPTAARPHVQAAFPGKECDSFHVLRSRDGKVLRWTSRHAPCLEEDAFEDSSKGSLITGSATTSRACRPSTPGASLIPFVLSRLRVDELRAACGFPETALWPDRVERFAEIRPSIDRIHASGAKALNR